MLLSEQGMSRCHVGRCLRILVSIPDGGVGRSALVVSIRCGQVTRRRFRPLIERLVMKVGVAIVPQHALFFGLFLFLSSLLSFFMFLHLLHLQKDVVRQLCAIVRRYMSALSDEEMINVHQPDLAELVLIEVHFHLEQIEAMGTFQVEADDVAHLEAVLQRLGLLQELVVLAELPEVKLDVTVERHELAPHSLFLRQVALVYLLEAGSSELERKQLAQAYLGYRRLGDARELVPEAVLGLTRQV